MEYAEHLRRGDAGFAEALKFLNAQFYSKPANKSVLFLLDYSGSMGGVLIKNAMASMHDLVREHIDDDDSVALTRFTHVPKEAVLGWTQKGGNERQIAAAI